VSPTTANTGYAPGVSRVVPAGGVSELVEAAPPVVVEEISSGGRRVKVSWFDPPFRPEPPDANQAYGICFTEDGLIVLVCSDDDSGASYWNLPGGGVEPGETLEGCLEREVAEEACAHVLANRYIGCQRVDDPDPPDGAMRFYQTRFWARVELLPWEPRHETNGRRLVRPEHFLRELTWGSAPTARLIVAAGAQIEAELVAGRGVGA
jgi:ADP-ribose pyrophosphatase YjhB (NUDIX family)